MGTLTLGEMTALITKTILRPAAVPPCGSLDLGLDRTSDMTLR